MFSLHDLLTRKLAQQTGFAVSVEKVKANPLTGRFLVENLEISNPQSFPIRDFVLIPELRLHASARSLFSKQVQVRQAVVHVRRLTGVRSRCGQVNLGCFRHALEGPERRDSNHVSSGRRVEVDELVLRVDHVVLADFAGGEDLREYPVLLERQFRNVGDPLSLGPVLVEAFAAAGLSHADNAIWAALLPDLLWMKIRDTLNPGMARLIAPMEI